LKVVLFLSGAIATFPLYVPLFFLPLYCESTGLKLSAGAAMVTSFNFSSAIGRIGLGLLCDFFGPLNMLFVTLLMTGISMLVLRLFSNSLAPLFVFTIWNGVASGGFFAVMPTVVGSVFGSQKMPIAMGMIVTGWAGGYLMGGPIAGYLLARYGGLESGIAAFRPAMYYAGSMSLGAAGLVALMRFRMNPKVLGKV
jgi:MFS family permease